MVGYQELGLAHQLMEGRDHDGKGLTCYLKNNKIKTMTKIIHTEYIILNSYLRMFKINKLSQFLLQVKYSGLSSQWAFSQ